MKMVKYMESEMKCNACGIYFLCKQNFFHQEKDCVYRTGKQCKYSTESMNCESKVAQVNALISAIKELTGKKVILEDTEEQKEQLRKET